DPQAFVLQGNSITYHIRAQNNPTNASDACDADHVLVQFCCPSPSGAPFPFGDFSPNHCVQLSAPGGDTFPAQPPLPPENFDVTSSSAGVTVGVVANGGTGMGDVNNPFNPDPALGTIHFATDAGFQISKFGGPRVVGCAVTVDKQVSCDGGATWHDVGQ